MTIKFKGKNPAANKHLQTLLEPIATKADNLLLEKTVITKTLTKESLMDLLLDGELIYWDLIRDENGNVVKVKPYPRDVFYRKLYALRKQKSDDVLYDFKSRLGEL